MAFVEALSDPGRARDALSLHRFLLRLCAALSNAFLWLFLLQWYAGRSGGLAVAFERTLLLYALAQVVALLLAPFAARLLRGGMRRGLVWGTVFYIASLAYAGAVVGGIFPHGAIMVALLFGGYRAFYRAPYAVEHAALGQNARVPLLPELLLALMPIAGGIFLQSGVDASRAPELLFASAALALVALLILPRVPQVYESFSWGYRETFGKLAMAEHHRLLSASISQGIFGALLFLAWPVLLFLLARGSYLLLGAGFSATLLVIFLARAKNRRVLAEQQADFASYIDEYTALKEMGQASGRLLFSLVVELAIAIWF